MLLGPRSDVGSGPSGQPVRMDRLAPLLDALDLDVDPGRARITGTDPVLPCRYPLAESAAAILAAIGLAAGRTTVDVDVRHAGALLRGFLDQIVDGDVLDPDPTSQLPGIGLHPTGDGRLVQVYGYGDLLEPTEAVLAAGPWVDADALADALAQAGAPGAVVRSAAEWDAHPQGQALGALPVVSLERIGDAPPEPAPPVPHVLDLSRLVAGPACGRTLAEHGAVVTQVAAPGLPVVHRALVDTALDKRRVEAALEDVDPAGADVFLQNAAPGSFERKGLGAGAVAARRPGIVYVSISGYGHVGPWAGRRAFEPLAQASTGWVDDHGGTIVPALPCDYATGFLAALGVLVALRRRAQEGGSWHVRTSLCRTAMWFRDQPGRYDPAAAIDLGARATADLRETRRTEFGVVEALRAP